MAAMPSRPTPTGRPRLAYRSLLAALALAAGCSRDLAVPGTTPPRIDAVRLVAREQVAAPAGGLPVLAGQLVALRGGGFPSDAAKLQVQLGGVTAEVLEVTPERIVVRVPALPLTGAADASVSAPAGFRALPDAIRYDGPGQPTGTATRDLQTAVPLWSLVPVEGTAQSAPELALGIGASDSALVFAAGLGAAVATVPLGVVPSTAAARMFPVTGSPGTVALEVLALDRDGRLAVGTIQLDAALQVVARPRPAVTTLPLATPGCTHPQLLMARGPGVIGAAVTWQAAAGPRIAALERDALGGGWSLRGLPQALPGPVVSWTASAAVPGQLLVLAGGQLLSFEPTSASPGLKALEPVAGRSLAALLEEAPCAGLGPVTELLAVAAWPWDAPAGLDRTPTERVAVAFRQAGLVWVATFDRHDPAATLRRGLAGVAPTALALAPAVPYLSTSEPAPLAAALGTLQRFARTTGPTVAGCATSLVVDAALPLGADPLAAVPAFGGLLPVSSGARLLALTPAGDVETALPASMTSLGRAFRLAVYGGVSVSVATVEGVASTPLAVAEHGFAPLGGASALDTGSAELLVPLSGDGSPLALGGTGYGRGAAWLGDGVSGALAYAGDVAATSTLAADRGGSTAVAVFERDRCNPGGTQLTGSRPVTGAPDLVAQGPARAGALGPGGLELFGPASAPVYFAAGQSLEVYPSTASTFTCLAPPSGTSLLDWGSCSPAATLDLGAAPLDLTLSAGDHTVASRRLSDQCGACAPPLQCSASEKCLAGDTVCQRSACPVRPELGLAGALQPATTRPLPGPPVGVAADAATGFLVTLACDAAAPPGRCFGDGTCDGLPAVGTGQGALLHLAEDGGALTCLAVRPALAGPVALTPNGAEAWVVGPASDGSLVLTRLALHRRPADGALDAAQRPSLAGRLVLGAAASVPAGFPLSGIAFAPDGSAAVVTVPGEFRVSVVE
jgi:hypothetical protein